MNKIKRILSCLLILCLLVSLAPAAFAAPDTTDPVDAGDGESVPVGNVDVDGYNTAVIAFAEDGSASVEVEGSITLDSDDYGGGAVARADIGNGSASVNVAGNVTVNSEYGTAVEATVNASKEGTAEVNVGGNVIVDNAEWAEGASANACANGVVWDDDAQMDVEVINGPGAGTGSVNIGGDVTVSSGEFALGVSANVGDGGGNVVMTVGGSVSAEGPDATAVIVNVTDGGSASATVNGAISASAEGGDGYAEGLRVWAVDGSTAAARVGEITASASGNNNAGALGVDIQAFGNSTVAAEIAGGISAVANDYATGVAINTGDKSTATVTVADDIVAEGGKDGDGVSLSAMSNSSINFTVDGSVSSTGEHAAALAAETDGSDAVINARVNGDLTGDMSGLQIFSWGVGEEGAESSASTINITVDGTISGGQGAIMAAGYMPDSITLTLWKAELDENGNAVNPYHYDLDAMIDPNATAEEVAEITALYGELTERNAALAEEIQENILYIIRLQQPDAGGTLSLSGTTKSDGFDVAKEGDNVILLIAVVDGYQIDAAYNGEGEKLPLQKDENGNYFLIVPRGGGVSLSAELSKIQTAVPKKTVIKTNSENSDSVVAATLRNADGEIVEPKIQTFFYEDKSFDIVIGEGPATQHVRGTFKLSEDGLLTLVLRDGTEVTIDENGVFLITLPNGSTLELKLSQATIDELLKLLK